MRADYASCKRNSWWRAMTSPMAKWLRVRNISPRAILPAGSCLSGGPAERRPSGGKEKPAGLGRRVIRRGGCYAAFFGRRAKSV
jgi:hypothetical protein